MCGGCLVSDAGGFVLCAPSALTWNQNLTTLQWTSLQKERIPALTRPAKSDTLWNLECFIGTDLIRPSLNPFHEVLPGTIPLANPILVQSDWLMGSYQNFLMVYQKNST